MESKPKTGTGVPQAEMPPIRLGEENVRRTNRWLAGAVVALAIAVAGLGTALFVRSGSQEAPTVSPVPTATSGAAGEGWPARDDLSDADRLMRRLARAVNALDAGTIAALYTTDAELHVLGGWSHDISGASAIGQFFVDHITRGRPFHIIARSLGFVIVGGDHFVFNLKFRGTGMSDNSRVEGGRGITMLTLEDGRIARQWYLERAYELRRPNG